MSGAQEERVNLSSSSQENKIMKNAATIDSTHIYYYIKEKIYILFTTMKARPIYSVTIAHFYACEFFPTR